MKYQLTSNTSLPAEVIFIQVVGEVIFDLRYEITAFCSAALLYLILSMKRVPIKGILHKKAKLLNEPGKSRKSREEVSTKHCSEVEEWFAMLKRALHSADFAEMVRHFVNIKTSWRATGFAHKSVWEVPQHLMVRIVELACKSYRLDDLVPILTGVPLSEEAVNIMLSACIRAKDTEMARRVETLARAHKDRLDISTYILLIQSLTGGEPGQVQAIIGEVFSCDTLECSADLLHAVLGFCATTSDTVMADVLFDRVNPQQANTLTAFIRFYIDVEDFDRACDVFEQYIDANGLKHQLMMDSRLELSIMKAAMHCGRTKVTKALLDSSKPDVVKQARSKRNETQSTERLHLAATAPLIPRPPGL